MTSFCTVSEFFKTSALAKLFNKHWQCCIHLKILSSIQKPANWLVLKINWLVYLCDIFCESLMHDSYSFMPPIFTAFKQHPSVYVEFFFKEFGWTILSNQQPYLLGCLLFSVVKLSRVKHLIWCMNYFAMSATVLKSRKLYLLIVRKCNHGK